MDMIWIKDTHWELLPPEIRRKCRMKGCLNHAVAALRRSNGWWNYCPEHLYGRRINNGVVEIQVSADSPAARRGYT